MNRGGFSWKTFFGITGMKRNFARKTGIPTSRPVPEDRQTALANYLRQMI